MLVQVSTQRLSCQLLAQVTTITLDAQCTIDQNVNTLECLLGSALPTRTGVTTDSYRLAA
jgi:hypothetical protein